jgi:hypothetical protein
MGYPLVDCTNLDSGARGGRGGREEGVINIK